MKTAEEIIDECCPDIITADNSVVEQVKQAMKADAIAFAEWMGTQPYEFNSVDNVWEPILYGDGKNSSELYSIYFEQQSKTK